MISGVAQAGDQVVIILCRGVCWCVAVHRADVLRWRCCCAAINQTNENIPVNTPTGCQSFSTQHGRHRIPLQIFLPPHFFPD